MKTVLMSQQQAEWAGNAVAVAGGWIAVGCDRVADTYLPNSDNTDGARIPGGIVALVPDNWTSYVREIDRDAARHHLLGSANGTEAAEIAEYLIDDEDDDSALLAAISAVSGGTEWDYDHVTKTARWADGREASVWLENGTLQMAPTI
jgi:hypothetical protein